MTGLLIKKDDDALRQQSIAGWTVLLAWDLATEIWQPSRMDSVQRRKI